jgi:hypothetical protein
VVIRGERHAGEATNAPPLAKLGELQCFVRISAAPDAALARTGP